MWPSSPPSKCEGQECQNRKFPLAVVFQQVVPDDDLSVGEAPAKRSTDPRAEEHGVSSLTPRSQNQWRMPE